MQLSTGSSPARSADRSKLSSPTSLDVVFAPMLQVVSTMRRFVLGLYERVLADGAVSAQMALVTHELLENAIKYNTDTGTRLQISISHQADPPRQVVEIRTRNRGTPENIRTAERLIARVREAKDPDQLYQQMMLSSVEQASGSGLGLARIRAETEMTIDVHVEGDEIEVVARALLPEGGAL